VFHTTDSPPHQRIIFDIWPNSCLPQAVKLKRLCFPSAGGLPPPWKAGSGNQRPARELAVRVAAAPPGPSQPLFVWLGGRRAAGDAGGTGCRAVEPGAAGPGEHALAAGLRCPGLGSARWAGATQGWWRHWGHWLLRERAGGVGKVGGVLPAKNCPLLPLGPAPCHFQQGSAQLCREIRPTRSCPLDAPSFELLAVSPVFLAEACPLPF